MEGSLHFRKTRSALIWSNILSEPLLTLYNLAAFILHKDLKASALQIAVLIMIRPLVSIISLYWSSWMERWGKGLVANVTLSGLLARLPFFFCPWIQNPWYLIAIFASFIMLTRGGAPAWLEIVRRNLPEQSRGKIFSSGSALAYLEGVVLALLVGFILDHSYQAWRWLFPLSASIGIIGVLLQSNLKVASLAKVKPVKAVSFLQPWQDAWALLKKREDFRSFQWAFMIGGIGIIIIQPALPLFFVDILGLSYTDMAIALSVCKGIGFAFSSPLWGKRLNQTHLLRTMVLIFCLMGAFPLLLLFSPAHLIWLYLAYTCYGISQAGSHLLWNLSGPFFAKDEEDSAIYTSVNVVMVGVRGAIIPPIGSLLCLCGHAPLVLGIGVCFFILGIYYIRLSNKKLLTSN